MVLAIEVGIPVADFDLVLFGEHGPDARIATRQLTVGRLPIGEVLSEVVLERSLKSAIDFGYAIVRRLGYTVQDCGHAFAQDIQWLLSPGPSIRSFSVLRETACVGVPLAWRGNVIRPAGIEEGWQREILDGSEKKTLELIESASRTWPHLLPLGAGGTR